MPLPNVNFDPTKTIIPTKTYAVWTPTTGPAVNLIGKIANYEQTLETIKREVRERTIFCAPTASLRFAKAKFSNLNWRT